MDYGRFTGYFTTTVRVNGQDALVPLSGSLVLTANTNRVLFNKQTVLPAPVTVELVNGVLTHEGHPYVELLSTESADSQPLTFLYRVQCFFTYKGKAVRHDPFYVELPPGSEVDLTSVTPLPNTGVQSVSRTSGGGAGSPGPQGPQGKQGVPGPIGPKGDKGDPGDDGLDGLDGSDGAPGVDGAVGPKGDLGDVGPVGPQGPQGDDGLPGSQGDTGEQGPVGPEGPPGADGEDGAPGPQGPPGEDGDPGPAGAAGSFPTAVAGQALAADADGVFQAVTPPWSGGNYFRSGYYSPGMASSGGSGSGQLSAGTLFVRPFLIPVRRAFDRISLHVTNAGAALCTLRLGIYAPGPGVPGPLVVDAGTVPGDTVGTKELVIALTLNPGLYWVAVLVIGGMPLVHCAPQNTSAPWGQHSTGNSTSGGPLTQQALVNAGPLPNPPPAPATTNPAAYTPMIMLRAA